MYIYDLPYHQRSQLVTSLNSGELWKDLAGGRLGYGQLDIQKFSDARYKPADSPTDALLTNYGQRNGTVEELFKHLHAMGLYQCMYILKDFVPKPLKAFLQHPPVQNQLSPTNYSTSPNAQSPQAMLQFPPSYFEPVKNPQHVPPPPLPQSQINTWLGNNLNNPSDSDDKLIQKDKGLSDDVFPQLLMTKDINIPLEKVETCLKSVPATADASPINSVPYNIANASSVNHSMKVEPSASGSILKKRMPSGVPLPENEGVLLINIPFATLKSYCGNFERDALIGEGGFGQVFKGKWDGQEIAVKCIKEEKQFKLNPDDYQRCINQAIIEIQSTHINRADNILPLLAISFDPTFSHGPCLVYQFMPNGSVSDRLKRRGGTPPLTWETRATIALGTARGLTFLHAKSVIHGDIKSANILLDRHFEPKIGDFGLARGGPENEKATVTFVSRIQGTQSYLPDDYIRSHELSVAVDTFCFGIFMFELVSGKSPSYKYNSDNELLREYFLDKTTISPEPWVDKGIPSSFWSQLLFYIGKDCSNSTRKKRPAMAIVLNALESLVNQPSPAMALQNYYDDHKIRHTEPSSAPNNQYDDQNLIPTILEEMSVETGSSSRTLRTCSTSTASNITGIDEVSLPKLSKFLSTCKKSRDVFVPKKNSEDEESANVPNISVLNLDPK